MGKMSLFLLLFGILPLGQLYSQWGKVDTVTSGDTDEFNPALDHGGLGRQRSFISLPAQWLVFERRSPDGSSVVARRFNNLANKWDTTDYHLSSPRPSDEIHFPDISSISEANALAVWQEKIDGYWEVFYCKWDGNSWSPASPLTADTSNNTHPCVRVWEYYNAQGNQTRFVIGWKADTTIWVNAWEDSGMTTQQPVAESNFDSTQFDLFAGPYSVGVLWTVRNGDESSLLCCRSIKTLDFLGLSPPDTLNFNGVVERPHANNDIATFVLFDSREAGRWVPYGAYISQNFADTSSIWVDPMSFPGADTTSSLKHVQTWDYTVIIDNTGRSTARTPASFGYGYIVFENIRNRDTTLVFGHNYWLPDTLATEGYNRNPSLGSFVFSSVDIAFGLAAWESNRTGYSHIYSRPFILRIGAVDQPPGLESFTLYQNYPNPFNPSTTISYRLSTVGHVTLTVYDVLGRKVKTLVDARQTPGEHSVTFDGRGLASGVYFYTLSAGQYFETRKMLVLK